MDVHKAPIRTGPITSRDRELLAMPSIASQMPIRFANGAHFDVRHGHCANCGAAIPDGDVRGVLVRTSPHMTSVEAAGLCGPCNGITRFIYRFHDDLRVSGPNPADGKWSTWSVRSRSILERVGELFLRFGR